VLKIERIESFEIWRIDRPSAKNALDSATLDALANAVKWAALNPTLRAIVLTGAGDTFVSGGDLKELKERTSVADAEHLSDIGFRVCEGIRTLSVPVIAAVNGAAIGGGAELALACDLRVFDANARISFKQAQMGVTTAWGTLHSLVRIAGHAVATRLLFTGEEVGASEALAYGIASEIAPAGDSMASAMALAEKILRTSPDAIAEMKRLLASAPARDEARAAERAAFVRSWTGHDHKEAVAAFFEKRAPRWRA